MLRVIAAIAVMLTTFTACAEDAGSQKPLFEAGTHYEIVPALVATKDTDKIEVTEVFWYGCGHCFSFEPVVHQWAKQLPDDVYVEQSPAIWNKPMAIHARAFYTAQALEVVDKVHMPIFNAMNVERKKLLSQEEVAEVFVAQGVDRELFDKTFSSFGITSQVQRAESRMRAYKITGTPELIVNGKYRISARMAGSQAAMLKVAEYLISQERASR